MENSLRRSWKLTSIYQIKVASKIRGTKAISFISKRIKKYPILKGFERVGLFRTMQFYETYKDDEIVAPLVRQICWTNNIAIFSDKSSIEEKRIPSRRQSLATIGLFH